MSVSVIPTSNFQREAKKLIKKYKSLKSELAELGNQLELEPLMGTPIQKNVYKIRLAVKSKGKGKRGGMRVITFIAAEIIQTETHTDIYLLSIYDKSDFESISNKKLAMLIQEIQNDEKND